MMLITQGSVECNRCTTTFTKWKKVFSKKLQNQKHKMSVSIIEINTSQFVKDKKVQSKKIIYSNRTEKPNEFSSFP